MKSYRECFTNRYFIVSFFSSFILLIVSFVVQAIASSYVTRSMSGSVADIVLSNIPVYNVGGIFVWGTVALLVIGVLVSLRTIRYVPFAVKSVAIFSLIRSFFVSLTHISPFPTRLLIDSRFFSDTFVFNGIFNGNDLFFSGHTGLPFLLALMFWDNKKLRYIFLGFSITFAVVVLLGHLHYTIDVLAAYFITYTIFHICKYLFKKDWQIFQGNNQEK